MDTKQKLAWDAILAKINELLADPGETYESVGKRIGVGRATVFEWRNSGKGGKRISFDTMLRYMRGLGLDPEEFFSIAEVESSEFFYVPKADAKLGAGSSLLTGSKHGEPHAFRKEFIRSLGHGSAAKLVMFDVLGDSMEPLIFNGDTVLVELAEPDHLRHGEIWAVWLEDDVLIKQILKRPGGGYIFHSENPRWADMEIQPEMENFGLIGRVLWLGRVFRR